MGCNHDLETMIDDVITKHIEYRRCMYQIMMLGWVV